MKSKDKKTRRVGSQYKRDSTEKIWPRGYIGIQTVSGFLRFWVFCALYEVKKRLAISKFNANFEFWANFESFKKSFPRIKSTPSKVWFFSWLHLNSLASDGQGSTFVDSVWFAEATPDSKPSVRQTDFAPHHAATVPGSPQPLPSSRTFLPALNLLLIRNADKTTELGCTGIFFEKKLQFQISRNNPNLARHKLGKTGSVLGKNIPTRDAFRDILFRRKFFLRKFPQYPLEPHRVRISASFLPFSNVSHCYSKLNFFKNLFYFLNK